VPSPLMTIIKSEECWPAFSNAANRSLESASGTSTGVGEEISDDDAGAPSFEMGFFSLRDGITTFYRCHGSIEQSFVVLL